MISAVVAMILASSAMAATESATIALPGDRAFPESVTASRDGTLYVGSVAQGGVTRIRSGTTTAESWIKPGTFGSASVLGVLADDKSNTLWVCSNDLSARGIAIAGGDAGSVLKGFDLKTGAGKVSAALPNKPALCNDIVAGPDDTVYVTNTVSPEVLRLNPQTRQLAIWFTDPSLQPPSGQAGLDGIAFGSDGNLYLDRYTPGDLFRITDKGGTPTGLTKLKTSRPLVLTDALRSVGADRFLVVESAGRLDTISVSGDEVIVKTLKDGLNVPTGVATVGRTAWISEGQLSLLFDPAKKDQQPQLPFKLYSVHF